MFQYLFFCCSAKQKEQTHTVTLDDLSVNNQLITKNSENVNCVTQCNNNNNCLFTETNNNNNHIIKIVEKIEFFFYVI